MFLYSLKSNRLYIGYTVNLIRRLKEHNTGNGGIYTSKNRPFILLYYEAFLAKEDAIQQELFYKTGYGREVLQKKVSNSVKSAAVVQR